MYIGNFLFRRYRVKWNCCKICLQQWAFRLPSDLRVSFLAPLCVNFDHQYFNAKTMKDYFRLKADSKSVHSRLSQ